MKERRKYICVERDHSETKKVFQVIGFNFFISIFYYLTQIFLKIGEISIFFCDLLTLFFFMKSQITKFILLHWFCDRSINKVYAVSKHGVVFWITCFIETSWTTYYIRQKPLMTWCVNMTILTCVIQKKKHFPPFFLHTLEVLHTFLGFSPCVANKNWTTPYVTFNSREILQSWSIRK